jgi:hypothetical protein
MKNMNKRKWRKTWEYIANNRRFSLDKMMIVLVLKHQIQPSTCLLFFILSFTIFMYSFPFIEKANNFIISKTYKNIFLGKHKYKMYRGRGCKRKMRFNEIFVEFFVSHQFREQETFPFFHLFSHPKTWMRVTLLKKERKRKGILFEFHIDSTLDIYISPLPGLFTHLFDIVFIEEISITQLIAWYALSLFLIK